MASKGHADNTVNERRLRPIYGTYTCVDDDRTPSPSRTLSPDCLVTTPELVTRLYNDTRYEASLWISDWLDNGNNKKALQEADKVLKKHPTNQCARVLKALALLRMGKENECQVIMDKVRSEVPCEDSTLQAMSICYREIHQRKFLARLLIWIIKITFKIIL